MKYIQYSLFFLLVSLIWSCEDETTSYIFNDLTAPTNLQVSIDVAQDDSGEVSITPTGEGVSSFQLFFGDTENESPTEVAPGNSATHVYPEGNYQLRVVGVGATGLTSEFNQMVNISFSAPENLEVTVTQDNLDPANVTVAASADNATKFEVYFGDTTSSEAVELLPNQTVEHMYSGPGTYQLRVVAIGAGAAVTEETVEVVVPDANDPITLPIDFESATVNYAFSSFGNAFAEVIDNPQSGGINTSAKVGKLNKADGAETWAGSFMELENPIDFSTNKVLKVKVYSPKSGATVRLKLENATNADIFQEYDVTTTTMNEWEELSYDLADVNLANEYHKVVFFFDFGTAGDNSDYLFDDIVVTSAAGGGGASDCVAETTENVDPANGAIDWTFKTNTNAFEAFGNISSGVVENPMVSEGNNSCFVQSYIKTEGCELWSGVGKGLENSIDLSTSDKIFTLKVLAPTQVTEVTLRLEFEPHPNTMPAVDVVQTISQIGVWETLTFDFSAHADKTFKSVIIYFDRNQPCDGATYYFDDLKQGGESTTPTEPEDLVVQDFEGASPAFTAFGNIDTIALVDNPNQSGINTSTKVARMKKNTASETWAGAFFETTPLNFDDYNKISVKVHSPKSGITVRLKVETEDPTVFVELDATINAADEWEELVYDFSSAGDADYTKVVIFFDFDVAGDDSIYFYDDVTLTN